MVATLPTFPALKGALSPINTSLRDLSHRVSAAPPTPRSRPPLGHPFPQPLAPHAPRPHLHHLGPRPVPLLKARFPPRPSIPTFPGMTQTREPFMVTPVPLRPSSPIRGRQVPSVKGSTPTPPPSFQATLHPTAQSPNPCRSRLPRQVPRRVRRIRAPLQQPKLRQPASLPSLRRRNRFPRQKEDSTLPVPRPPNTCRLP